MYLLSWNKKNISAFILGLFFYCLASPAISMMSADLNEDGTIDRIELIVQQNLLLKNRLAQSQQALANLQKEYDETAASPNLQKASKNVLDKVNLDISVSKSNLEGIRIELADAEQSLALLVKNIQEIENQLNVINIFGLKLARHQVANMEMLKKDLTYQQHMLILEKSRVVSLQELASLEASLLQLKKDQHAKLSSLLKSYKLLHVKQQQSRDELAYQEEQSAWLNKLDLLYAKLSKIDPVKAKDEYTETERQIFYTNEKAHYANTQALLARYTDQIKQVNVAAYRGSSISILNEMSDQVWTLSKQVNKLDAVLKSRVSTLDKHVAALQGKKQIPAIALYLNNLHVLTKQYKISIRELTKVKTELSELRVTLDQDLQAELSSRQSFPIFSTKSLLELGKEMLLVPALTLQVVINLFSYTANAFYQASWLTWTFFALMQAMMLASFFHLRKRLTSILSKSAAWQNSINSKWLSLQWLHHNFVDLAIMANFVGVMWFFNIPRQHYMFVLYLCFVWLVFKCFMLVARISLIEATHDDTGHDVWLYHRLKWMVWGGGIITAMTVFFHQLPLIYEVKTLADRAFLFFLMLTSLLILRSWQVVSRLILSHIQERHPYIQKSIRLVFLTVPLLMFGNSIIGMMGYVNLVMTVSWYEGIFLFVLVGYLIIRGLLSDAMEHLSALVIQHVHNGWLWTEAFLKPIHRLLRLGLFILSWAVLFILYGWDKESPIVERLTRLFDYQLVHVLNTTITPLSILKVLVVISVFYWTAKWTREFVFRLLSLRTKDMGIRNSIAILSQYGVVMLGIFICLRVLGIDLAALAVVAGMFAFGIGLGLRDLANNFACGFLILLERPLRVGDIVSVNQQEGEVRHIGGRAVTIRTWEHTELVVPNAEIFNKSFVNWTARDNIVRSVVHLKIARHDNPHTVKVLIQDVLLNYKDVLKDPAPEVFLKEMTDTLIEFELRYFVNIRLVKSRISVMSAVLLNVWDVFAEHNIKPPYPQHKVLLHNDSLVIEE